MTSNRAASLLWIATLLSWPLQLVVALRWPSGYSWTDSYISDLGMAVCGTVADDGPAREVCSPAHAWWNGGLAVVGVLTVLGALLLLRTHRRPGEVLGLALVAAGGLAVVVVGLVPFDVDRDLHDLAALAQFVLQIAGMVVLAASLRIERRRSFVVGTVVAVVVAVAGFLAFLAPGHAGLGVGTSERIAFETLTLWTAVTGMLLLRRRSGSRLRQGGDHR